MRRWLAVLLALLMMTQCAAAEILTDLTSLARGPLQMTVSAEVESHMPLGPMRTDDLNALLRHMKLLVRMEDLAGETWSEVNVLVDDSPVVTLVEQQRSGGSVMQASCLPDISFFSEQDSAIGEVLSVGEIPDTLFGLTGRETALLTDAEKVLLGLRARMADRIKSTKKAQTLKGYGKVATTETLTFKGDEADAVKTVLLELCPDGMLHDLLADVTFSGKQTLTMLCTAEGAVYRATWTGNCAGADGKKRNVKLVWKMKHDDPAELIDEVTLTSPALTGTDKNTLTIRQSVENDGDYALEFSYDEKLNKATRSLKGSAGMSITVSGDSQRVSGKIRLREKRQGGAERLVELGPDVTIDHGQRVLNGTLRIVTSVDEANQEAVVLSLRLEPLEDYSWSLMENTTVYEALSDEQLANEQALLNESVTAVLIRRLVLLPYEDTMFLSRDLSQEAWNGIVEAARRGLQ